MQFCDKCGHELKNENAKFCDKCGAEIKNTNTNNNFGHISGITCPHCGKTISIGQIICPNCGAEVYHENNTVAIVIGYLFLLIVPLISLIVGIYLLTRNNKKSKTHGVLLIIFVVITIIANLIVNYYSTNDWEYLIYTYGSAWNLYEFILKYVMVPVIGIIIGAITWLKNFTIMK